MAVKAVKAGEKSAAVEEPRDGAGGVFLFVTFVLISGGHVL
jgi:hypothetical protein